MNNNIMLQIDNLNKYFTQGENKLHILKNVSLVIHSGEVVGLVGPSGAGKSTLLQISGLLDTAQSGKIIINTKDCANMKDKLRTNMRLQNIGFIYQFHHLLPEFTALENLILPQLVNNVDQKKAAINAKYFLEKLGLSERLNHYPAMLSGGEQQRVAVARAFINNPKLILADEPTGNLDEETANKVFNLMKDLAKEQNIAMLIVTHNVDLASKMDRIIKIKSGELQ